MRLETGDSGQSAAAPSWSEVCAPENIQDSGEMKFHLKLYYDFVPILLETFTFWMQNDDNITGHLLYLFMCSLLLIYCKITLVLVSEDEYLLDIYTIYYLVFTVTRAAVDTRSHFTRLWSGLSMKYESYCHLSQHWQHCSWLNLLLQTRFSFIFSPWTWKCGKVVPLVW